MNQNYENSAGSMATIDVKDVYTRLGELEVQDKVKDQKIDQLIQISKETLQKIDSHVKTFINHDEKEMKKYEDTDRHIRDLTHAVDNVAKDVAAIKDDNKVSAKRYEEADTHIHKRIDDTNEALSSVVGRQNKFIGGLAALVFVSSIVVGVFYFVSDKIERYEDERRVLQEKLLKLEVNQNRNHAVLQDRKGK